MTLIHDLDGAKLYCGNTIKELDHLEENSVHCCVTSPPYWNLRDYNCEGQIGMEATPQEFIKALVEIFRKVRRCLHETGCLWVNIGDSFGSGSVGRDRKLKTNDHIKPLDSTGPVGIPWMLAQAMREDGWLLRSEILWIKLAAMPESVNGWRWEKHRKKMKSSTWSKTSYTSKGHQTPQGVSANGVIDGSADYIECPGCDKCNPNGGLILRKGGWRPARAHEHIFLFSKSEKYYCDREAVMQPARSSTVMRDRYTRILDDKDEQFAVKHNHETESGGKSNPRSWLVFKGEPLSDSHYAAFPSELPTFAIKAGTSQKGQCPYCGTPWSRIVVTRTIIQGTRESSKGIDKSDGRWEYPRGINDTRTKGWRQSCECPKHEPVPCVVLDPFAGSCTTGQAALMLNRQFIGIDLSEEYLRNIGIKRLKKAIRNKGFGLPM